MPIDIRDEAARYYDLNPEPLNDLPFYRAKIPSRDSSVLELGCGTGRVLVPLTNGCGHIHGVDISEAMISICRQKLVKAGISPAKAQVRVGDITQLNLCRRFDLITAPYRVFQNLETDSEVDGFFETVRRHLSREGTCILNVFKPNRDPSSLLRDLVNETEYAAWETYVDGDRVTCHARNVRMDSDRMILYPELIYRRYHRDDLSDEAVLKIAMRCYYPAEFEEVIMKHGFDVIDHWGGYSGERYGEGPELVIQFREGSSQRSGGDAQKVGVTT
jgi:ubiquinone/menaquinone biosynthesis C-methylase UbiE